MFRGHPVLAVKLQEMFGLADTTVIAGGRVKVLLHLLSPGPQARADHAGPEGILEHRLSRGRKKTSKDGIQNIPGRRTPGTRFLLSAPSLAVHDLLQ